MATINDILNFADNNKEFTRKGLIEKLRSYNPNDSFSSLSKQLNRLLKSGQIIRIKHGVYSFPERERKEFYFKCSDELKGINSRIKKHFPFISYCLWDNSAFTPYMLHISNINVIYVDVERDVAESVFNLLNTENRMVYLMPSETEFERYISGNDVLIIRQLISESPIQTIEGVSTPTIEKILVDMVGDIEFSFLQGSELHHIYSTAFERNMINKSKLIRYASRRGRKEKVQQLLNSINL